MKKNEKISARNVLEYYQSSKVLDHYEEATKKVGLWKSEELIYRSIFSDQNLSILELGCGAGRISFSLWDLGFKEIIATDFSKEMIGRARSINRTFGTGVVFEKQDATNLPYFDKSFDGIIFGFNGLMQIPGRSNRFKALKESHRVLRSEGRFIFTTHDRTLLKWRKFWKIERKKWRLNKQNPELIEFGDRFENTEKGKLFIHVPEIDEVRTDLKKTGFVVEKDFLRSKLAEESELVRNYSDECRFWVCRKPI